MTPPFFACLPTHCLTADRSNAKASAIFISQWGVTFPALTNLLPKSPHGGLGFCVDSLQNRQCGSVTDWLHTEVAWRAKELLDEHATNPLPRGRYIDLVESQFPIHLKRIAPLVNNVWELVRQFDVIRLLVEAQEGVNQLSDIRTGDPIDDGDLKPGGDYTLGQQIVYKRDLLVCRTNSIL
jgi:hypothetical protein